ncbi:MAG: hypothetical protein JNM93_11740 [Bacteriovoracaceae bacterium]|nr:hypothetical protein [Bacteriovoracaceae bacterium]
MSKLISLFYLFICLISNGYTQLYLVEERIGQTIFAYPVTVKDNMTGKSYELEMSDIRFYEEPSFGSPIGRIKFNLDDKDFTTHIQISSWDYWNAQLAYEAIKDASKYGPIKLTLGQFPMSEYKYTSSENRYYFMSGVYASLNDEPSVSLNKVLAKWKRRQELEAGRYYGLGGGVRYLYDSCVKWLK